MCGHRNTHSSTAWGEGHQKPRAGRQKQGRKSWSQLPAFLLDQPSQSACSSTGSLTVRPQTMEQGWEVAPREKQVCCFPRPVSSNISLQPSRAPGSLPEPHHQQSPLEEGGQTTSGQTISIIFVFWKHSLLQGIHCCSPHPGLPAREYHRVEVGLWGALAISSWCLPLYQVLKYTPVSDTPVKHQNRSTLLFFKGIYEGTACREWRYPLK